MATHHEFMDLSETVDLVMLMARREHIAELCHDISRSGDMSEAIELSVRYLLTIFGEAGRACIAMLDDDGETCHLLGAAGSTRGLDVGARLPLATTTVGLSVRQGRQLILQSGADNEAVSAEIHALWAEGFRAVAITPLIAGERVLGSLNLARRDGATFLAEERTMLAQIAAIVAANLERHRLLKALKTALADSRMREQELLAIRAHQQAIIQNQEEYLAESAAPMIPISDRVLVIPVNGTLDDARAQHLLESVVYKGHARRVEVVILDLTGLRRLQPTAGRMFPAIVGALRLIGARVIITGVSPAVARQLVDLGYDLSKLMFQPTLHSAVNDVLRGAAAVLR